MDASYRGDLRELNELNYARFEAKTEQRIATLEARLDQRFATLESRLEARIDTKLDSAVAQHAFAQLDAKLDRVASELRTGLEKGLKDQTRWLILALGIFLVPLVGLWLKS